MPNFNVVDLLSCIFGGASLIVAIISLTKINSLTVKIQKTQKIKARDIDGDIHQE